MEIKKMTKVFNLKYLYIGIASVVVIAGGITASLLLTNGTRSVIIHNEIIYNDISVPSSPASKTYNGSWQASGITCPEHTTRGGSYGATDAGTYYQICTVQSPYNWTDGSTGSKSISWTISKKPVSVAWSSNTPSVNTGITGETMQLATSTREVEENTELVASCSSVTGGQGNCGNYALSNTTKIVMYAGRKPTSGNSAVTYDGNEHTSGVICPTGSTSGGTNTAIDAGDYIAKCSLKPGYVWSDGTIGDASISWRISKKVVTVNWANMNPSANTGIANETMQLAFTVEEVEEITQSRASCSSITGGQAKCSNYSLSNTTSEVRYAYKPNTNPSPIEYDGKVHNVCPTGSTASGTTTSAQNVGDYVTKCTLNAGRVWTDKSTSPVTVNWKIIPKKIDITWNEEPVSAVGDTGVTGETIKIGTNITDGTTADDVILTAVCIHVNGNSTGCNNYEFEHKELEVHYIDMPLSGNGEYDFYTYDGKTHSLIDSCPIGSTLSGDVEKINVGDYSTYCTTNKWYYWRGFDGNTVELKWGIEAASLAIIPEYQTITYGDSIVNSIAKTRVTGLINGDSITSLTLVTEDGEYVTNSGSITYDKKSVKIMNNGVDVTSNYNLVDAGVGTLVIEPRTITVNWNSGHPVAIGGKSGDTINLSISSISDDFVATASCNKVNGDTSKCDNYNIDSTTSRKKFTKIDIPTQDYYPISYTGKTFVPACPTDTSYDLSGGINVGKYTVSCMLLNGYIWSDKTFEPKKITYDVLPKLVSAQWIDSDYVFANGVSGETINLKTPVLDGGYYVTSCDSVTGGQGKCENYSFSNLRLINTYTLIDKPTGKNFTYDGTEHVGVVCPTGSTSTGNYKATDYKANYVGTCTLVDDTYRWSDGSNASVDVTWHINKKDVAVTWNGNTPTADTSVSGETMSLTYTISRYNYTATASCTNVTNGSCNNYNLTNKTKKFDIVKPLNDNNSFEYTGQTITYSCPDNTTATGNKSGIYPKDYVITCTPNSGYVWSDTNSTGARDFNWSITAKKFNVTWNGFTASASTSDGNAVFDYTLNADTIVASCKTIGGYADRCNRYSFSNLTLHINRVTKPRNTYEKVYTGNSQVTPIVCPNGTHIDTSNDHATGKNVGEYTRTCVLNDGYLWSDSASINDDRSVTLTWKIVKAALNVPSAFNDKEYNGTEQNSDIICPEHSTIGGTTKATNAGSYAQTCTLDDSDNYEWDKQSASTATIQWMIKVKVVEVTWDGGNASANSGVNNEKINLKTPTFTNGRYSTSCDSVTGGQARCSNYMVVDNISVYTVVQLPGEPTSSVYDGSSKWSHVQCPAGSKKGGETTGVNAGKYEEYCDLNNGNYVWSDGTFSRKWISWYITPATLTIKPKNQTITYGGSIANGVDKAEIIGLVNGDSVTNLQLSTKNKNVTNNGIISYSSNSAIIKNSSGKVVNGNYNIVSENGKLVITPVEIEVPSKPADKTYNGLEQSSGVTCPEHTTTGGTTKATNAGSYTQTCVIDDYTNYRWAGPYTTTVTVVWKINQHNLTITSLPQTITYLEKIVAFSKEVNAYAIGIQGNDEFVSVNFEQSITNAGEGSILMDSPVVKNGTRDVTSNYNISYVEGKLTINKRKIEAPTNVQINSSGVVTWTSSKYANYYDVKVGNGGSAVKANGTSVSLYNQLKDASGLRTVYVQAKSNDTNNFESSDTVTGSINVYNVVVSRALGSTVSGAGNYIAGEKVVISATLYAGYKWENWTHDGLHSSNMTYTINSISKNEEFTAVVSKISEEESSDDTEKPAKPSLEIIKYNAFNIVSSDNIGVAAYCISKENTKPLVDDEDWVEESIYTVDSAGSYYVWVKDAAGNISDMESINAYDVSLSGETGTTLYLVDSSSSDRIDKNAVVLSGVNVTVNASLNTGFKELIIKANGSDVSSGANYEVKSNVTFSSTSTFNDTKPVVSITKINHNTFIWSASTFGNEISEYAITKSTNIPSSWNPVGAITTDQYSVSNAGTYYVWVKDAVGNISEPAIINAYLVEYASFDGTLLEARYDSNSATTGTEFNSDIVVLNGTEVWVSASLVSSGYKDLVFRKNDTSINGASSYIINENTKFESSATLVDTDKHYNVDYRKDNNYVYDIQGSFSVSDYKENISHTENYRINITKDGNELRNTDLIGTGSITKIYDGDTLIKQYTNIVPGDVTGDGNIALSDVSLLFKHFKQKETLENAYLIAGDVTGDNEVKLGDVSKLYKFYKNRISSLN